MTFKFKVDSVTTSPSSCVYDDSVIEFYIGDFTDTTEPATFSTTEKSWTLGVLNSLHYPDTTTPHTITIFAKFKNVYEQAGWTG